MIQLADDPSEDVRWRIPGALASQKDRDDVGAILTRLLRDPSPSVRYFTIMELGPKNHVTELREISKGKDAKYAEWAVAKLKQLGIVGPADQAKPLPMTRAVPVDNLATRDLGVMKQTCEIDVPEGMKISLLYRVYRQGKPRPESLFGASQRQHDQTP